MSAEILRRAASLMRERAEAADTVTWYDVETLLAGTTLDPLDALEDAEHIASWHPTGALAVADWLTVTAWWLEDEWPDDPDAPMDWESSTGATAERVKAALAVARAYLGEETR